MVMSAILCQVVALGKGAPDREAIPKDKTGGRRFPVVSEIVDRLADGALAKSWVDSVIDECAHLVNLRQVLDEKRRLCDRTRDWTKWQDHRDKYVSFSERFA